MFGLDRVSSRTRENGCSIRHPRKAERSISRCVCRRSRWRSEEHTSELQSQSNLVCRLLLEKKKINNPHYATNYSNRFSKSTSSAQPHLRRTSFNSRYISVLPIACLDLKQCLMYIVSYASTI